MRFMYMRPRRDIFGHFAPFVVQYRYLLSALSSDCTKSLVTVRSHSTVPAALALSLGAPAGPSRSAGARRSGPIYSDRPARSARSKLRVRRAATGVGRPSVASYACTQPTAASLRPSLEVPTQGLSVTRFKDAEGEPVNAKHQCGYCENRVHCYCDKCFPDGEPSYAICNPNTGRACFAN